MVKAAKAQAQKATMSRVVRENGSRESSCFVRALIMADMAVVELRVES
jgi:hypothetical protein